MNLSLGNISIPQLTLPKLPALFAPKAAGALVIRSDEVQAITMGGASPVQPVRVPIGGSGEESLTQALTKAVTSAGLSGKRVAVSIPTADVLIRSFAMPAIPKPEWENAVHFEVRRYIPFKPESLVWDYQIVSGAEAKGNGAIAAGSGGASRQLEVVFAGIPRETFQRLHTALSVSGIKPLAIEPMSVSLARLAQGAAPEAVEGFVCLVDVEAACAHVVIARNGAPYLSRDINLSHGAVASAIDPGVGAQADPRAQRLLSELNVSMDFFTRQYPTATMTKVWLFGDDHVVASWYQTLASQARCPVELGNGLLSEPAEQGLSLTFGAAAGLLRLKARSAGPTLDFLKRSRTAASLARPSASSSKGLAGELSGLLSQFRPLQLAVIGGLAAAVIAGCWYAGARQVATAQRQLDRLAQTKATYGRGLDALDQKALKPIMEEARKQLKWLDQIIAERISMATKLDALARSLPEGVWLTGMLFEGKWDSTGKRQAKLSISGACFLGASGRELSAIQEFERRVKRNPALFSGFTTAQLDQISAQRTASPQGQGTPYTYRTFVLNCQYVKPLEKKL